MDYKQYRLIRVKRDFDLLEVKQILDCLERCVKDIDCGENMVCLSEFCECAKQKYKRISGPRCIMRKKQI
jgi:hypothetical protein